MKMDFRFLTTALAFCFFVVTTAAAQNGLRPQDPRGQQNNRSVNPRNGYPANGQANNGLVPRQQPQQQQMPNLQPKWVPLPQDHQNHIDELLIHWERQSSKIKQCTTEFRRWDYNARICNHRNPKDKTLYAYVVWDGKIRYSAPDKAHYETTQMWSFAMDEQQKVTYKAGKEAGHKQKWICDGKKIYEFDYVNKILSDVAIPPEFQGERIGQQPTSISIRR